MIRVKAIKNDAGEWELDVLGVPYGGHKNGRDSHNEYFDSSTELHEDRTGLPSATVYHSINDAGDGLTEKVEYVGAAKSYEDRHDGRWYRVILDKLSPSATKLWQAAKDGVLFASSGTADHMKRVDKVTGWIKEWPVYELALIHGGEGKQPANRYAIAIPRLKAMGIDIDNPQLKGDVSKDSVMESARATGAEIINDSLIKEVKMSEKDEKETAPALTLDAIAGAMKAQLAPLNERLDALEDAPTTPLPFAAKADTVGAVINADSWKYDNYDAGDLGMAMNTIKASGRREPVDPAMQKAFFQRLESDEALKDGAMRDARNQMKRLNIKANETDFTTNVGFGAEWVGTTYSDDIWKKVRQETFVIDQLAKANGNRTAAPGSSSIVFPLEGSDPEWYTIAQAGDPSSATAQVSNTVPAKALGTGKVTGTFAKSGTSTTYTGEMLEDSVVDFLSQYRMQLAVSGAEILEAIAINGDTEAAATTNINDIAGTAAATDWFMAANGFRKLALVTNSANSRDGGALASSDFIETMKLMGNAGLAGLDPSKSAFIIDPYTHYKAIQLADVKSLDVFTGATIENGRLTHIFGTPVFVSGQINKGATNLLANAAGKVDLDVQANNTTGSIVAVRWDQWRFGYRRDMTMEVERIPRADAWEITALMRYHLTARDNEAAAMSYNLTV